MKAPTAVPHGVLIATFDLGTGYGDAGAEYARGLHRAGVPVCWSPMVLNASTLRPRFGKGSIDGASSEDDALLTDDYDPELRRLLDRSFDPDLLLVHAPYEWWSRCGDVSPGARTVIYTTWEADRLPPAWPDALNRFDLVLVPSHFNRRSFIDSGVRTRVEVVPHAARPVRTAPGAGFPGVDPGDYVFYTIGEWRARKNLAETVRAYLDAFRADDPVVLIVKTSEVNYDAPAPTGTPPHSEKVWWMLSHVLAEYRRPAKLHLIAGRAPRLLIDQLHTRGDCFVSLTHGEGWGLGAFEAALFDNPTIITGWGGQLDYLGDDYPLLVPFEMVDADAYGAGAAESTRSTPQRWALPDRGRASELMRTVFDNRTLARELGTALGAHLRREFASEKVAERLAHSLGFEVG